MKKLFAILLAITMALCVFGMPAAAESEDKPFVSEEYEVRGQSLWVSGTTSIVVGNNLSRVTVSGYKNLDPTNSYVVSCSFSIYATQNMTAWITGYTISGMSVTVYFSVTDGYSTNTGSMTL